MNINDEHGSEEALPISPNSRGNVGELGYNINHIDIDWRTISVICVGGKQGHQPQWGISSPTWCPLLSQLGLELGWLGFIVILAIVRWSYNPTRHRPSHYKYSLQEPISYLWVYGRHIYIYTYIHIYIYNPLNYIRSRVPRPPGFRGPGSRVLPGAL